MNLVKTNETVLRNFVNGEAIETITNERYDVYEGDEKIGDVHVHTAGFNFTINKAGTIAEHRAMLEQLLANNQSN